MVVRELRQEEIPEIAEIEKECFSHPWSEKVLDESFSKENYHFIVVEIDGCIAGYIGMYSVIDELDITNVAVKSDFRRRGVGDALIEATEAYARENNMQLVFLEVRDTNAPAIFLYEKHGFHIIGRRKNYYSDPTEDAILYALTLG